MDLCVMETNCENKFSSNSELWHKPMKNLRNISERNSKDFSVVYSNIQNKFWKHRCWNFFAFDNTAKLAPREHIVEANIAKLSEHFFDTRRHCSPFAFQFQHFIHLQFHNTCCWNALKSAQTRRDELVRIARLKNTKARDETVQRYESSVQGFAKLLVCPRNHFVVTMEN